MKKNKQYWIRKSHRYLGLFIGLQFIGWTVSGLYFSWNDLDSVHGDHFRKPVASLPIDIKTVSPQGVIDVLQREKNLNSLKSLQLVSVLDNAYYQIGFLNKEGKLIYTLADASTGEIRPPLSKEDAENVAKGHIIEPARIQQTEYLEEVGSHHEYRGRRLPVWAITFENPACTVYISSEMGTFQTIRHNQWRAFDFLWMFHTMDYVGRDNFNNWLLKIFSVFGLFAILSGFVLFSITSKSFRKLNRKNQ